MQRPSIAMSLAVCFSSVSHIVSGQAAAHLIEQVHRSGLPLAQLFNQRDALLELRAPRLELLHLLDDALQARGLPLRVGDLLVELLRLVLQRPVPPAHEQRGGHQDEAAPDGDFLRRSGTWLCASRDRDRRQGG